MTMAMLAFLNISSFAAIIVATAEIFLRGRMARPTTWILIVASFLAGAMNLSNLHFVEVGFFHLFISMLTYFNKEKLTR